MSKFDDDFMNNDERVMLYGCGGIAVCVIIFVCWLLYKVAAGTFHLIDKVT